MTDLAARVPLSWRSALADELKQPYLAALDSFVMNERVSHSVHPSAELTFEALRRTPPEAVKVVLLGQDPYPTRGNAMGLSFSVPRGHKIPASLRNIYATLNADTGATPPAHGDLSAWADRGVLLLNTVLTVREGEANSHQKKGWERLTGAVLQWLNAQPQRIVFLSLGKQAQAATDFVDRSRHSVVKTPHPSPLVIGNPFGKTRPFSEVNQLLLAAKREPIDWQLPL